MEGADGFAWMRMNGSTESSNGGTNLLPQETTSCGGVMDPPRNAKNNEPTPQPSSQQADHCKRRPIDNKFLALLLDQSELHGVVMVTYRGVWARKEKRETHRAGRMWRWPLPQHFAPVSLGFPPIGVTHHRCLGGNRPRLPASLF